MPRERNARIARLPVTVATAARRFRARSASSGWKLETSPSNAEWAPIVTSREARSQAKRRRLYASNAVFDMGALLGDRRKARRIPPERRAMAPPARGGGPLLRPRSPPSAVPYPDRGHQNRIGSLRNSISGLGTVGVGGQNPVRSKRNSARTNSFVARAAIQIRFEGADPSLQREDPVEG
ncbi:MAG: hypothetical protein ACREIU_00225 [Planctomycetota bacterium]